MANNKSAEKRARKSEKARCRNVETSTIIKKARRVLFTAVDKKEKEAGTAAFKAYCSVLDKSVKRGIITRNTAIRRKARASNRLKSI